MSKGVALLDDTVLAQFLGTEGIEELRTKVIDMIVSEIHAQLIDSTEYIISPDDISNCIVDEVVDEIKEQIKDEYKEKITDAVNKKLAALM